MDTIMERKRRRSSMIEILLPPELVVSIAMWLDVEDFVQFQSCNQQTCRLLKESIPEYIRQRTSNEDVHTLPQLALVLKLSKGGFLKENRIGFDYASAEIAMDSSDDDSDNSSDNDIDTIERSIRSTKVRGSLERIYLISHMMTIFPSMTVRVDAHCGTIAPSGIAENFSRTRGIAVQYALENCFDDIYEGNDIDVTDRITVQPWGRRAALAVASQTSHPFGDLARHGKGWVEIYVDLDGMQLPSRPSFYNGLSPYPSQSWF
ncbi:unnamed protein product [Cylindrotheca closterium]|uniref:F-box domain-containing protein n=1 Tax=Cylindrotheca closterium TaxID=2856 RepID=A0AAD2FGB8_9STRA|nr:unnamed protein product [Cylindrotheca closterium]